MLINILAFAAALCAMTGLAVLMGKWLARVFTDTRARFRNVLTYRLLGVDPNERMGWARYGMALLLSNAAIAGFSATWFFGSRRVMPLNPLGLGPAGAGSGVQHQLPRSSPIPTGRPTREKQPLELHPDGGHHRR